jgi:hypothetical protein
MNNNFEINYSEYCNIVTLFNFSAEILFEFLTECLDKCCPCEHPNPICDCFLYSRPRKTISATYTEILPVACLGIEQKDTEFTQFQK